MASKTAYLEHLANIPLFSGLSRKELQLLASLCDETQVPAGRVLIREGAVGWECYVLVDGKVKVERESMLLNVLGPGTYFGELALLDKQPRSATVTALTDCTVLVMGPREFSSALDSIPGLSRKLLAGLAKRVRELDARVIHH